MLRLPARVNRIVYVRHLPYEVQAAEIYQVFGKYGAIRQVRVGVPENEKTRGTGFVVYEDIMDAKNAVEHLSGYNIGGRYIAVTYHKPASRQKRQKTGDASAPSAATSALAARNKAKEAELEALKKKYGVSGQE
jgi:pre-mRNA branch site protein p14